MPEGHPADGHGDSAWRRRADQEDHPREPGVRVPRVEPDHWSQGSLPDTGQKGGGRSRPIRFKNGKATMSDECWHPVQGVRHGSGGQERRHFPGVGRRAQCRNARSSRDCVISGFTGWHGGAGLMGCGGTGRGRHPERVAGGAGAPSGAGGYCRARTAAANSRGIRWAAGTISPAVQGCPAAPSSAPVSSRCRRVNRARRRGTPGAGPGEAVQGRRGGRRGQGDALAGERVDVARRVTGQQHPAGHPVRARRWRSGPAPRTGVSLQSAQPAGQGGEGGEVLL